MNTTRRSLARFAAATALLALSALPAAAADVKIESRFADVAGLKMHYLAAGQGSPVILLHGYAQNSHMWRPTMKELAKKLGIGKAGIAGHDIGLMVAYAYAAQYPDEVTRIALLDAFIPGVGDTTNLFLLKDLWHFHFYGPTPLAGKGPRAYLLRALLE